MTRREARRPTADLVADLRRFAEGRFVAPTMPPVTALAEVLIHGQDIRIPLGLDDGPAGDESWSAALDFLLSKAALRGFVRRGLPDLAWLPDGAHAPRGQGAQVGGPVRAMALAVAGRPALLDRLSGPGVAALTSWLNHR
jgi:hypothetical protein